MRPDPAGGWTSFERLCGGATSRHTADFGVTAGDLTGAPHAREVWAELREFLGDRPVLTDDAASLATWSRALDVESGTARPPLEFVGLDDLAVLVEPGHLAALTGARIVPTLIDRELAPQPVSAVQPPHVLAACAELVARFHDLGPAVHAVAYFGWSQAHAGLAGTDPVAARRLALGLSLIDRPSTWAGDLELFTPGRLSDGILTHSDLESVDEDDPLAILSPAVADRLQEIEEAPQLAPDVDEPAPFLDEDLALLDDLFRLHLPHLFAKRSKRSAAELYRASQHRVAEEVARCLGSDELLMVHAPTGTGKTLAYLLPALMWSRRYGVRVGVATYTRALQSQAMEREVPRAIEALRRAGLPAGFRISVLKGREHSLCWRSLRIHAPSRGDDAELWLAWTTLALFGLRDGDGDLDRFPRRAPVQLTSSGPYRGALGGLVAQVRARSGCCTTAADRASCAAEVARRRAERSHVVLTNQSFALARPEFFRRVVFDECEHLHDQAMSAWSHRVSFPAMRRVLLRLHDPDPKNRGLRRQRGALDRLRNQLPVGSGAAERLHASRALWSNAMSSIARLESGVLNYERWRSQAQLGRTDAEAHSLFREYVETQETAHVLVEARDEVVSFLGRLDASLAQLAEELERVKLRRAARIRRALELARVDMVDLGRAVAEWLPTDDGMPRFGSSMFHDVERNVHEELILVAQVLLPGDVLGRHYYPELGSAAFVSATTRLGGSFDSAKGYLGLDRVAQKDDGTGDYDRNGGTRRVTTFHAPEVFDYSRVLVGLPRGVPSVRNRDAYIEFLARYLPWFAERSRGRMLCLFTSLRDIREVAARAAPRFEAAGLPLLWQGMDAAGKEELSALFRERVESTLFGVDTFWYGADFPGETLETLVLARLPYGVPDRYHHAQCAAIGANAQRHRIYMPRALAKFRQGFGRLMRTATDRGTVLVLDGRITERRHGTFLKELPLERPGSFEQDAKATMARGDLDLVGRQAFAHLGRLSEMQRRSLSPYFLGNGAPPAAQSIAGRDVQLEPEVRREEPPIIQVDESDLPF